MTAAFHDTYEIQSIIAQGGMSIVYLVEHKRLHTRWAMKQVRKQQEVRFDFLAESNILKRLQHPMLPRIVDIFEDEDSVYIIEDFVEGITLEDLLRQQGRVDEALVLQWSRELCGVLYYLHAQQPHPIIYRDLKPSNVMLQPDGSLKLIDFGIAREYKQGSDADTTYVGTKGYAAPEQFGQAQTDARTDIYALGVTMYHLATGKSPYSPPYQFVPARQLVPTLSHGIEYILNKCVQPEPIDRYQDVVELVDDLDHIYRFDRAWKRCQNAKRIRAAVLALLLTCSLGLMAGGWIVMGQEKEAAYLDLLARAETLYTADCEQALDILAKARAMFPDRVEADRQQTYALYLNGDWQGCIQFGERALEEHGQDVQTRLSVASAQFELGDYEQAAEGFAQGEDLSVDHLRDYAVCLGRLGRADKAERVLEELIGQGARPDVTQYVQGEVFFAQEDYLAAEAAFLETLEQTGEPSLARRCYISLADLYRDCAALARIGNSPIPYPATRSVQLLSEAVVQEGLRYDPVLWEALALACFESYHTDVTVPASYLSDAANCFQRVIELGVTKEYLYTNLYTIRYELGDFAGAEQALKDYEERFPQDYMPHALRGMMLITIENGKAEDARDYRPALAEYETAGSMVRSSDDTTYYQQLGSLIDSLRRNGWL